MYQQPPQPDPSPLPPPPSPVQPKPSMYHSPLFQRPPPPDPFATTASLLAPHNHSPLHHSPPALAAAARPNRYHRASLPAPRKPMPSQHHSPPASAAAARPHRCPRLPPRPAQPPPSASSAAAARSNRGPRLPPRPAHPTPPAPQPSRISRRHPTQPLLSPTLHNHRPLHHSLLPPPPPPDPTAAPLSPPRPRKQSRVNNIANNVYQHRRRVYTARGSGGGEAPKLVVQLSTQRPRRPHRCPRLPPSPQTKPCEQHSV